MTRNFLIATAAVAVLSACASEEVVEPEKVEPVVDSRTAEEVAREERRDGSKTTRYCEGFVKGTPNSEISEAFDACVAKKIESVLVDLDRFSESEIAATLDAL